MFDQYVDSEFVNHASSIENRKGLDELKTPASAIRRALPDLQMEIVGIWEVTETNGDIVVFAHTIMTGTHQGKPAFHGHPPWREIIEQVQMHLFWMREGKAVAHKAIRADLAAVMQACGAQSAVELLVEAITI